MKILLRIVLSALIVVAVVGLSRSVRAQPDSSASYLQECVGLSGGGTGASSSEYRHRSMLGRAAHPGGDVVRVASASFQLTVEFGCQSEQLVRKAGSPVAAPGMEELPTEYQLGANYPNPFNPRTTIPYALPRPSEVRLTIYDVLGREVRVLIDGQRSAGSHEVAFEAGSLPSGLYWYRLRTEQATKTRSMMLVK